MCHPKGCKGCGSGEHCSQKNLGRKSSQDFLPKSKKNQTLQTSGAIHCDGCCVDCRSYNKEDE